MSYFYATKQLCERAARWLDNQGIDNTLFTERGYNGRIVGYRIQANDMSGDALAELKDLLASGRRWDTITREELIRRPM